MFINAAYSDESVIGILQGTTTWFVQSIFQRSLNIQNNEQDQLILITSVAYPKMPHAIYLAEDSLNRLIASVGINQSVKISDRHLRLGDTTIFVTGSPVYQSQLVGGQILDKGSLACFLQVIMTIEKRNGFDFLFSEIGNKSIFDTYREFKAFGMLFNGSADEQIKALRLIIGRGKGLTPSGDDMLIGAMAANIFLPRLPKAFAENMLQILSGDVKATTTVSEHYLRCALQGRFNEPIKDLLQALCTRSGIETIEKKIMNITEIGHTSGLDMLTGFAAALILDEI